MLLKEHTHIKDRLTVTMYLLEKSLRSSSILRFIWLGCTQAWSFTLSSQERELRNNNSSYEVFKHFQTAYCVMVLGQVNLSLYMGDWRRGKRSFSNCCIISTTRSGHQMCASNCTLYNYVNVSLSIHTGRVCLLSLISLD